MLSIINQCVIRWCAVSGMNLEWGLSYFQGSPLLTVRDPDPEVNQYGWLQIGLLTARGGLREVYGRFSHWGISLNELIAVEEYLKKRKRD